MVLAFDGLLMAAIASEFRHRLIGARVDKIYQPSKLELIIIMRQPGQNITVFASSQPEVARVHITQIERKNPPVPPAFCMLLRKYLVSSKVTQVTQLGLDRVLEIRFLRSREETPKNLVIEVMGRHSNIALVDEGSNTILDSIKHVGSDVSRIRHMGPGIQWSPPPAQDKLNLLFVTKEELNEILHKFRETSPDSSCSKFLVSSFSGFGRDSAAKILSEAGITGDESCGGLSQDKVTRLGDALLALADSIRDERFLPHASQLLDAAYSVKEDQRAVSDLSAKLLNIVNANMARCERKLKAQNDEISQAKKDLGYRKLGDLITVNAPTISPGQDRASLVDYFDSSGGCIEVQLDPRLSPYENAQNCFARYTRAKRALESVAEQIEATERELDYLEQVAMTLQQVDTLGGTEAIRAELIEQGYLKEAHSKKAKRERKKTPSEVASVSFSIQGYEILVGRNNKENDRLTMKVANADDVWMHARGIPGAHVIIKMGSAKDCLPEGVLMAAAEIAAHYSNGRGGSKVAVDYTYKRHVRKPKAALPGMVIYDHEKTIMVRPVLPDSDIMQ